MALDSSKITDDLTGTNDKWSEAVNFFTGYKAPNRSELFDALVGNEGIPLMKVEISDVGYVDYVDTEDLNWLYENAGSDISNTDFVIPFYHSKGEGAGSDVSMYKARITLLGSKGDGRVPSQGYQEGGKFSSGIDGHLGMDGKPTWDTTPTARYAYGTGLALEELLNNEKEGTHGFSWNGLPVDDANSVTLGNFDVVAGAFDRVAQFFISQQKLVEEWQSRVGTEKNEAWRGKAAGVFWDLVNKINKQYTDYAEDMSSGKGYSKQGNEIRQAKKDFRAAVSDLHSAWAKWEWEYGNPLTVLHKLLSAVMEYVWDHNITKITYEIETYGTYGGGYSSYTNYISESGFSNKAAIDKITGTGKTGLSVDAQEFGELKELSTWEQIGNKALLMWQQTVEDQLDAAAITAMTKVRDSWSNSTFDLGSVKSRGTSGTLASDYKEDKAEVAEEEAEKKEEEAAAAAAAAAKKQEEFIQWQKDQAAKAEAAAAAAKAEQEEKERKAKAEQEEKERKAKEEQEAKEAAAEAKAAAKEAEAEAKAEEAKKEQEAKEAEAKAEQEQKEKEAEQKQAEQEAKQEAKEAEAKAEQEAKEKEAEQKQAEQEAKQEARQAEQEAKQEQLRKEQEAKQAEAQARAENMQMMQMNQARTQQEEAKKEQAAKEAEAKAEQEAKEKEAEQKQAEQEAEQEAKQAEQEAKQEAKEKEAEQKQAEQEAKQDRIRTEQEERQEQQQAEQEKKQAEAEAKAEAKQAEQEAKQEAKEKEAEQKAAEQQAKQEQKQAEAEAKQEEIRQEQEKKQAEAEAKQEEIRQEQEKKQAEAEGKQEEVRQEQEKKQAEAEAKFDSSRRDLFGGGDLPDLSSTHISGPVNDGVLDIPGAGESRIDSSGRVITDLPDGSTVTIDPATHSSTVTRPDGSTLSGPLNTGDLLSLPGGGTTHLDSGGNVVTELPDGSVQTINPDTGTTTVTRPDGTTVSGYLDDAGPSLSSGHLNNGSLDFTPPSYDYSSYEEELFDDQPYESPLAGSGASGGTSAPTHNRPFLNSGAFPGPTSGGDAGLGTSGDTGTGTGSGTGTGTPMGGGMGGGMGSGMGGGMGGGKGGQSDSGERVRNVIDGEVVPNRRPRSGAGAPVRNGRYADDEVRVATGAPTTGGTPFLPPMAGGGGGGGAPGQQTQTQSGDRARDSWVPEDDDVWGTDEGGAPAVIGR
nr:AAWKG family protein [Streptomyces sp. NBC_01177]